MGDTLGKSGGGGKRLGPPGRVKRPGGRAGAGGMAAGGMGARARGATAAKDVGGSEAGASRPESAGSAAGSAAGSGAGRGEAPRGKTGEAPGGKARAERGAGPAGAAAKAPGTKFAGKGPAPWKRREAGFLQAGSLTAAPLREASARRGFAEMRILTDWEAIVGEALAAACRPLKVGYAGAGFGATLTLEVEGARAVEIEMQGPRIVERVNAHYGYRAISRIKIMQAGRLAAAAGPRRAGAGSGDGVEGFADPAARFDRGAGVFEADIAGVEDEGLRAALARLGARVGSRASRRG